MAQKKAPTDEELLAQFEGIGNTSIPASSPSKTASKSTKAAPAPLADDPLAELENLAKAKPPSRPHTPKVSGGISRREAATPTSQGSARNSGDSTSRPVPSALPRKSGESTRSFHQGLTPTSEEAAESEQQQEPATKQAEGSWWGGFLSTATAAAKQAQAAVKEIQKNEEAQKWVEQVRGNVGAFSKLGGDLRSRALPTFTSIMNTLAPPISQHERLQIHITHDLISYPSLEPTIYQTFSRVMSQVEGGDLLVIQRGSESFQRRPSEIGFSGGSLSGWNDGPWWRDGRTKRDMAIVNGLVEGTKLCRASVVSYSSEFFASRGGLEEAAKLATQNLSESNPVRSSDIFLAIQAVGFEADEALFDGPPEEKKEGLQEEKERDDVVAFAVYLHDPIHSINFSTLTQAFPKKWANWLDAENVSQGEMQLPEEIIEIIKSGGVDPREWVAEWVEEILSLGVGVVAQRYVARRMGVGEGGIGRGKAKEAMIEAGAGEAARAGMI